MASQDAAVTNSIFANLARQTRIWCLALICVASATSANPPAAEDAATTLFYDAHVFTAEYDHPYAESNGASEATTTLS
jgi:hypothetical protein